MPAPLPEGCRERTVATATLQSMHLVEAGKPDAPLVVLLHGFPEFWYSWRHQLRALAADFHVVAADMRGYGGSEKPPTGYDLPTLAADIDALLAFLTRDDPVKRSVTLVGHDWGGAVAWATASLRPERIDRLVAIDAPHVVAYLDSVKRHPLQLLKSWYILMFQIPGLMEWRFRQNPYSLMARILRSAAAVKDVFARAEVQHYVDAMSDERALPSALAYYRAIPRLFAHLPALRQPVRVPTLVLWGAEDPALGTELVAACSKVVQAPFSAQIVEGGGHWLQQEKPDEVNAALLAFAAR